MYPGIFTQPALRSIPSNQQIQPPNSQAMIDVTTHDPSGRHSKYNPIHGLRDLRFTIYDIRSTISECNIFRGSDWLNLSIAVMSSYAVRYLQQRATEVDNPCTPRSTSKSLALAILHHRNPQPLALGCPQVPLGLGCCAVAARSSSQHIASLPWGSTEETSSFCGRSCVRKVIESFLQYV